jgi:hypothetical protein
MIFSFKMVKQKSGHMKLAKRHPPFFLMLMLKQTTDDTTQTKQNKFNIRNFPATKAKAVGFKTKKAMIECSSKLMVCVEHVLLLSCVVAYGVRCSITGGRRERD